MVSGRSRLPPEIHLPARKDLTNQRGQPQHGAEAPADRRLFEPGSADHGYPNRQSSWQWARSRPADTPQPTPLTAKRGGSPGRPASVRARQRRPRLPKPTELLAAGRARSRPAIKQSAPRRTHRNTTTQTDGAPGNGPGSKSAGNQYSRPAINTALPGGLEPPHLVPETSALSPELRERVREPSVPVGGSGTERG